MASEILFAWSGDERRAPDDNRDAPVSPDGEVGSFLSNADPASMEPHTQFKGGPRGRQDRVDVESARVRAEPRKSEGQCLPCAAHGGEMQARSGRARQVVEIHACGDAQRTQGGIEVARTGQH